jgi:hypothetical protein
MFIKGEGGFLDRDPYPFCGKISDGTSLCIAADSNCPSEFSVTRFIRQERKIGTQQRSP